MDTKAGDRLAEFQSIISKMSVEVCCAAVLPELGVRWADVRQAVRSARLPMTSASVARVLRRHVATTLAPEEIHAIVAQLRITLVASSGGRVWHAVRMLHSSCSPDAAADPARVARRVRRCAPDNLRARLEVHATKLGDFLFLSLRRGGGSVFAAAPPGEPAAFFTSLASPALVAAAVNGLGYKSYANAHLYGKDLISLLRITDRTWNVDINQLTQHPEYAPAPVVTKTGIDYTNKAYDEKYVDSIIGPNPPLLNNLDLKSEKPFFDTARLNKSISVRFSLKSDDIAKTLRGWVVGRTIPPTSEFIKIFHQLRSNKFTYNREDED